MFRVLHLVHRIATGSALEDKNQNIRHDDPKPPHPYPMTPTITIATLEPSRHTENPLEFSLRSPHAGACRRPMVPYDNSTASLECSAVVWEV
jgi:hypothetical protein